MHPHLAASDGDQPTLFSARSTIKLPATIEALRPYLICPAIPSAPALNQFRNPAERAAMPITQKKDYEECLL